MSQCYYSHQIVNRILIEKKTSYWSFSIVRPLILGLVVLIIFTKRCSSQFQTWGRWYCHFFPRAHSPYPPPTVGLRLKRSARVRQTKHAVNVFLLCDIMTSFHSLTLRFCFYSRLFYSRYLDLVDIVFYARKCADSHALCFVIRSPTWVLRPRHWFTWRCKRTRQFLILSFSKSSWT